VLPYYHNQFGFRFSTESLPNFRRPIKHELLRFADGGFPGAPVDDKMNAVCPMTSVTDKSDGRKTGT
jgi:hypothetical protein